MLFLLLQFFGSSREERIRLAVGTVVSLAIAIAAVLLLRGLAVLLTILVSVSIISVVVHLRGPGREKWNQEMRRPLGSRAAEADDDAER